MYPPLNVNQATYVTPGIVRDFEKRCRIAQLKKQQRKAMEQVKRLQIDIDSLEILSPKR